MPVGEGFRLSFGKPKCLDAADAGTPTRRCSAAARIEATEPISRWVVVEWRLQAGSPEFQVVHLKEGKAEVDVTWADAGSQVGGSVRGPEGIVRGIVARAPTQTPEARTIQVVRRQE